MTKVSPIFQDLDLHIRECDYRYTKLENKLDSVDDRLAHIEQLILDLKNSLKNQ